MGYIQAVLEELNPVTEISVFVDGDLLRAEIRHYKSATDMEVVADAVVDGIDLDSLMGQLDDAAEQWLMNHGTGANA